MIRPAIALSFLASQAGAQAPPDYDFNFLTIGNAGNSSYDASDPFTRIQGRGVVNHEYRMARTEITTEQFVPFVNALNTQGEPIVDPSILLSWGAIRDQDTGLYSVYPGFEMAPVYGINWHVAAIYTNWLHNDKGSDTASFVNGAYDSTTFLDGDARTDQVTHHPDAKYWIPSFDEWLKAAHYDPNRNGQGEGGWWTYSDGSETPLVPGIPGVGETSAGMQISHDEARLLPLESYPNTQSPYGLLDLSGGASEWTEELLGLSPTGPEDRVWQGNQSGTQTWDPVGDPYEFYFNADAAYNIGADQPGHSLLRTTVRIASSVPSPGTAAVAVMGSLCLISRRRSV